MRQTPDREQAEPGPARPYIGGQAVLEGVMMRAPKSFAVVVRRRDGSLHVRERAVAEGPRGAARWPLLRGIATLVESLRLGSEALRFSAEQMEKDLRAQDAAAAATGGALRVLTAFGLTLLSLLTRADGEPAVPAPSGRRGGRAGTWIMLLVAIGFFVMLPQAAAQGIVRLTGWNFPVQSPPFQAITGVFKLAIVVGYMLAIRRIP